MAAPSADSQVFVSYSRRDYYFAESLVLHLLKEGVPAWMDVKNLNPGVFWERDLFASLEAANCVIFVASPDSLKSPNCRQERDRAISLGKRIIVARFRGTRLPDELCRCEIVDFRGAFAPALRKLIACIRAEPPGNSSPSPARVLPKAPLPVVAVVFFLLVPTIAYFARVDWSSGTSSPLASFALAFLLLILALGWGWLICFSFLQRKMGMTRLALSLTIMGGIFAFPVVLYLLRGTAGLASEASGFADSTVHHLPTVALTAALPLLCLALIVLLQPYDLLRWTPTGKAWRWYRRRCTSRVFQDDSARQAPEPKQFVLLHDEADTPAAECIRQDLMKVGWTQSASPAGAASVLLLTNRTSTNWLLQEQAQLTPDVLTVVATTICLPAQLEWLWQREWIDLRSWKIARLHSKEGLPQVPEAVTVPHFPAPVKFAHHLLCCLAALAFVLLSVADPSLVQSQGDPTVGQEMVAIAGAVIIGICVQMARKLLRRSVTAVRFYRWSWLGYLCVLVLAIGAWHVGVRPPVWLRTVPVVAFLLFFPFALLRTQKPLAFWFPLTSAKSQAKSATLAGKKYWRTLGWLFAYLMLWGWISGMMDDNQTGPRAASTNPNYAITRADWSATPR
jgi:hypothetical protein